MVFHTSNITLVVDDFSYWFVFLFDLHARTIRLDIESKTPIEPASTSINEHSQSSTTLSNIIQNEFAHLSKNTFSYELKPLCDKPLTNVSAEKSSDSPVRDYELTCRLIEMNMPIVPPLKLKLTVQYPQEPPEILSLTSTSYNMAPAKLENSGWTKRDQRVSFDIHRCF